MFQLRLLVALMELGELLRSLFFVFDVDLFTDIYRLLLQIVFTTPSALEGRSS
jgi:hypothetical protein